MLKDEASLSRAKMEKIDLSNVVILLLKILIVIYQIQIKILK